MDPMKCHGADDMTPMTFRGRTWHYRMAVQCHNSPMKVHGRAVTGHGMPWGLP